jgi:peptidoglycan LD-endopeptidase CwlK
MASRDIKQLTPRMQIKIERLLDELAFAGMSYFKISCTYRSQEEQNALYARGRQSLDVVNNLNKQVNIPLITDEQNKHIITQLKHSVHTDKEAVDFYILKDGKYCDDLKVDINKDDIPDWDEFGALAAKCGLEWGGSWKTFKDYPHVQWKD